MSEIRIESERRGGQESVDRTLEEAGEEFERPQQQDTDPVYKVVGASRIPTSREHGKLWQSRRDQAWAKRRANLEDISWEECIRYYENDQVAYRVDSDGNWNRNDHISKRIRNQHSETENIVFSNTSSMTPAIVSKNPDINIVDESEEENSPPFAPSELERLINRVIQKRHAPGVNLKPHLRRAVVHTTLTNVSYIEVGFVKREDSTTQAVEDLQEQAEKLRNAKNVNEIREAEGALMSLERKVNMLRPAGPWVQFRRANQVLWDTNSQNEDRSDANWMMIDEMVETNWLLETFGFKGSDDEVYKSIYRPSHVLHAGDGKGTFNKSAALSDEIVNFTLMKHQAEDDRYRFEYYGYNDHTSWTHAWRTRVFWVWDRVTRRVYLYNHEDWSWPIWVMDDPYNLESFFPVFPLTFYTDPNSGYGKSEVSYYLDQQDAINEGNSERKRARHWARKHIFYDIDAVTRETVEKAIHGPDDLVLGVKVPEGKRLEDVIKSYLPPSAQFIELFDKTPQLEAIDRVSSVTAVQRGAEYKTNTTNVAIAQYDSNTQTRLDEKLDAVEDCTGQVGWALAQMCLQFMDQETVAILIGAGAAESWTNMGPEDIRRFYSLTVVGGSSVKPTSQAQKRLAMELGQVLGQFASVSPVVFGILARVLERAFNEVLLTQDDWDELHAAVGSPGIETGSGEGASAGQDPMAMVQQLLASLPPEATDALSLAVQRGVPVQEALMQIIATATQSAPPQLQ